MMINRWKKIILLIHLLMGCVALISCDTVRFVYVDDKTFQKQISHLKDAHIVIVYQIDPTEKRGYEVPDSPWPAIRENRFTERNSISDELCNLIFKVIKRNQRHVRKGWYPTYMIYVKYTGRYLYFIPTDEYLYFDFDFRNLKFRTSGRAFVLSQEEANLIEAKLNILLQKGSDESLED